MDNKSFFGKKVLIMGLGLHGGGVGVAKFFCKQGADVLVTDLKTKEQLKESLDKLIKQFNKFEPQAVKELAKGIAEFSNSAAFVAFSDNDFYYTGLSNLFSQPEFTEQRLVYSLSRVIDHLDQVVNKIFNNVTSEVKVIIGSHNPFAKDCSSVLTKYRVRNSNGLLGILGPIRMDYQNNINLVKYSQQVINGLGR